jgi:acyl dehydratase
MVGREDTFTSREELGKATIRRFAKAVGDPNPIYWDDEAARKSPFRGITAPPTLIFELNHNIGGDIDEKDGGYQDMITLPPPLDWIIRGGHEYTFIRPARPGDRITVHRKIDQIYEKQARTGPLVFVVCVITYSNQKGQVLGINRETLIYMSSKKR